MKPHYKLYSNGRIVRLERGPFQPTFLSILLRLKTQLCVSKDKEVAKVLGLSACTLSARKVRESFPSKALLAVSARRPELKLDVGYILTGELQAAPVTPISLTE